MLGIVVCWVVVLMLELDQSITKLSADTHCPAVIEWCDDQCAAKLAWVWHPQQ